MIKKIALIFILITLSGCETIKQKTGDLKKPLDICPPKDERTLKDIFCRESK
tara:strand:- start:1013 stop:1168 length:156 start_codon:yes stop_codon:yes gene_type:complete